MAQMFLSYLWEIGKPGFRLIITDKGNIVMINAGGSFSRYGESLPLFFPF